MLALRVRLFAVLLALIPLACEDEDEVGTPCESEADCSEALICDVHDGKGTCQVDHGHRVEAPTPELAVPLEP